MFKRHPCTNRKNLEIFLLICLMLVSCVLLTHHVRKSISNVSSKTRHMRVRQELIDERQIRATQLKSMLQCHNRPLHMERLQYGQYWLLKNLIRGRLSIDMGCAESITYTTNGDYTFIENLGAVVSR